MSGETFTCYLRWADGIRADTVERTFNPAKIPETIIVEKETFERVEVDLASHRVVFKERDEP